MRGYLQPAKKNQATEAQSKTTELSRHRRTKLARAAQTTLVKVDQWARGETLPAELATALETAFQAAARPAPKAKAKKG